MSIKASDSKNEDIESDEELFRTPISQIKRRKLSPTEEEIILSNDTPSTESSPINSPICTPTNSFKEGIENIIKHKRKKGAFYYHSAY